MWFLSLFIDWCIPCLSGSLGSVVIRACVDPRPTRMVSEANQLQVVLSLRPSASVDVLLYSIKPLGRPILLKHFCAQSYASRFAYLALSKRSCVLLSLSHRHSYNEWTSACHLVAIVVAIGPTR
ncbi:hypothetical protein V8B97DRAFT_445745 [Scleroderma yunnanense]